MTLEYRNRPKRIVKSFLGLCALLLALPCLSCSTKAVQERITQRASETGQCFEACAIGDITPPPGYADLIITASVKVPKDDPWLFGRSPSRTTAAAYPLVININGQGEQWPMTCKEDMQDRVANGRRNPEGGEGLKCSVEKRIRMQQGSYKVYLGLHQEACEKQVTVVLSDGSVNHLDFSPIYFRDTFAGRVFWAGVIDFNARFNGKPVRPVR